MLCPQGQRVVSVGCGAEHSVVSTDEGAVYSFGWGQFGALAWLERLCAPKHGTQLAAEARLCFALEGSPVCAAPLLQETSGSATQRTASRPSE